MPTVIFFLSILNYFRREKFTFLCRHKNVSEADKEEELPWMSGVWSCGWRCLVGIGRVSGMWWEGNRGFPEHEDAGQEVKTIDNLDVQVWARHPVYNETCS